MSGPPRVVETRLDAGELQALVTDSTHGAVVMFQGVVRDRHQGHSVTSLEYTAYLPMAESALEDIIHEAHHRWQVRVEVRHRIGRLTVGETSVLVVAAGAHREEAFMACRHVIDEVKARVPIWKRERYADGWEVWVDPTAPGLPGESG